MPLNVLPGERVLMVVEEYLDKYAFAIYTHISRNGSTGSVLRNYYRPVYAFPAFLLRGRPQEVPDHAYVKIPHEILVAAGGTEAFVDALQSLIDELRVDWFVGGQLIVQKIRKRDAGCHECNGGGLVAGFLGTGMLIPCPTCRGHGTVSTAQEA